MPIVVPNDEDVRDEQLHGLAPLVTDLPREQAHDVNGVLNIFFGIANACLGTSCKPLCSEDYWKTGINLLQMDWCLK
jgi:hypothetical protein